MVSDFSATLYKHAYTQTDAIVNVHIYFFKKKCIYV